MTPRKRQAAFGQAVLWPLVYLLMSAAAQRGSAVLGGGLPPVILLGLAGPVGEELTYRALSFRYAREAFGEYGAALLTSALFAAAHPAMPLPALDAGLFFAMLRMHGGIAPAIAAHAALNLYAFLPAAWQAHPVWLLLAMGAATGALACQLIEKRSNGV